MKNRVEVTIRFSVNHEKVPGVFYDPQEFAEFMAKHIEYQLQAYKPKILEKKTIKPADE